MELERSRDLLARQGLGAAAISFDSVAVLKDFAARRAIHYPLLSDPDSRLIRSFGLLNTTVKPDSPIFGVPYPGLLLVDENGIVRQRFFEDDYRERYTVAAVLASRFGFTPSTPATHVETPHLELNASSSAAAVRGGQRIALVLDIAIPRPFHLYAPGVAQDYIPVRWDLAKSDAFKAHDPAFPPAATLDFLGERLPVYENRIRITRDITLAPEKALRSLMGSSTELAITGAFRYQACNDRECFPPRSLPLEWRLRLEPHDSERAPPELRRLK